VENERETILFEHPPAPCASRYRAYASPESTFTALARTCGAEVRVQGADPEGGSIPDADWIKVLDATQFVREVLARGRIEMSGLPDGRLSLDTDAGAVTLICQGDAVSVQEGIAQDAPVVHWPSGALAQLLTGYRPAETLDLLQGSGLPADILHLLSELFPPCWRFSRNESWTYRS
jgi:hypothetical protein